VLEYLFFLGEIISPSKGALIQALVSCLNGITGVGAGEKKDLNVLFLLFIDIEKS
jgi:hypothetical protein